MIRTTKPQLVAERRWLTTGEYVRYLLVERKSCSFLKTEQIQDTLSAISRQENLKPEDLLQQLSGLFQINELSFNARQLSSLSRLSQVAFLVHDGMLLPAECIQESNISFGVSDQPRVFFLSATLPKQKLTKKQFVNTLMDRRWSIIALAIGLGSPPVIASAVAELLQQPLFDNFVPEGRISPIILVGFATIILQLSAQIFTTMQTLAQSYFTQNLDLETKVATAQRFLSAETSALPQKDIGSWRLTFSVASAFLGSINALLISIPLAVISMIANILVIGAFTDLSAVWNLFLILLIPTGISIIISYLSSNISVRVIGQQSSVESTIYDTVRQIRGIWLTNTESVYVINGLFQGFLYAFIFYQYYRSYLDPSKSNLSVGSLLVIYFAIGSLSGSLASIAQDLVSIAQSLPTYWMPNAIRDISSFSKPRTTSFVAPPQCIVLSDLKYTAANVDYPFSQPISLELNLNRSYALVGPSGSGKSTLISLLIGHLNPRSGSVQLYDENQQVLPHNLTDCRLLVLGQDASACGSYLSDVVDPSRHVPIEKLEDACRQLGLSQLLDSLPLRWKTPVNEFSRDLSLGQLQRFKIARALVKDYDIIISDEATCHLPEDQHLEIMELLNKRSKLHISVLHRVSALSLFDNAIVIDRSGGVSIQPTSGDLQ
jgi:ABC-type bacteriocin/lantibiotic exporter with double-glycine peptidase domain